MKGVRERKHAFLRKAGYSKDPFIAGRAVLRQPSSVLRFFKRLREFPEHTVNPFGTLFDSLKSFFVYIAEFE